MSLISLDQLNRIMPGAKARAALFIGPLNAAMVEFSINSEKPIECFLPQIAHESGDLWHVEENLNYSAAGLANTWRIRYAKKDAKGNYIKGPDGKYLPNEIALRLHRKPEAIANHCYANREGNGDEASGDGWRHRGAGLIQLTFLNNQRACAEYFGIPLDQTGNWLRTPEGACRSAAWFFKRAGCIAVAERGDFDGVSDLINIGRKTAKYGDAIGFADRMEQWELTKEIIT